MNHIFILDAPVLFVILNTLTFSCSLAACTLPWYFIGKEDVTIGLSNSWKLSFFQLTNITTLTGQTEITSSSYASQAPSLFAAFMVSFGFQLATTLIAFCCLVLSIIYLTKHQKFAPQSLKNLNMTLNALCSLVTLFSFVAIFQFAFSLRQAFRTDEISLIEMSNCDFDVSICNSFMNKVFGSTESWSWGPYFGWLLGLASCLLGIGGFAVSMVLLHRPSSPAGYELVE